MALLLTRSLATTLISQLPPVVIVPGDGSNQLEAKLDKPSVPHIYCAKTSGWYRLWLNTAELLAKTSCWADNIRLVVNSTTGSAANAPGVDTRVPYFGSTEGFEELDPSIPAHATAAFFAMVNAFVAAGYVRNATLRGAPYDFRLTPDTSSYAAQLRSLIEETVAATGGRKATLISHSMGGLQTLYFLRAQTHAWKAAYIERWIPISTPFAGAAKIARLFASGDNEGLPVSPTTIRDEQRSYETNLWLYPRSTSTTPWASAPLVLTDRANFTANDTVAFFDAIGYPVGNVVNERVNTLLPAPSLTIGPGVPVLCLYSTGVDTPRSFDYRGGDFSQSPKVIVDDGDGTVNAPSLRLCEQWAATQPEPVEVQTFQGVSHSDMIMDARVIALVVNASIARA